MANYFRFKHVWLVLFLIFVAPSITCADVSAGKMVLYTHIYGFEAEGDDKKYAAGADTKFYIVDERDEHYQILFKKEKDIAVAPIKEGYEQVRPKQFFKINKKSLPKESYRLHFGIAHGPLIVPFKLRTNDGSLTGQSTLGYYLGIKSDFLFGSGTLFGSAGITLIPVKDVNSSSTDEKTGVSWAFGYSFASKSNFQAAIIVGWDHLGGDAGDSWEYEDDTWVSFAIGFEFM